MGAGLKRAAAAARATQKKPPVCVHKWSGWKEIGRTGDWFHPIIVERKCETCGVRETDEH